MKEFRIDLDSFCEEVFLELERVQDGGHGHEAVFHADDKDDAILTMMMRLRPFLNDQFEEITE